MNVTNRARALQSKPDSKEPAAKWSLVSFVRGKIPVDRQTAYMIQWLDGTRRRGQPRSAVK